MFITPQRIWHAAYTVGLLAVFVFCYTLFFRHEHSPEAPIETIQEKEASIPYSFQQKKSLQDVAQDPFFTLSPIDRPLRLPDLRNGLSFLGCNERPDLSLEKMRVQFVLRGGSPSSACAGDKIYLKFDCHSNKYNISEKPTSLSIVFKPRDNGVDVIEEIVDASGALVTVPSELHQFFLTVSASSQGTAASRQKWEVGDFIAEPLLLEKLEARWFGKDEMMHAFGGEEYADEAERERIQFGAEDDAYVLWVKENDTFIFDEGKWEAAELGAATKGKILLRSKKIDERQMLFDLWNPDGSLHVVCTLNRREAKKDPLIPQIKLIGDRSQTRWIAEVARKRITLNPTDWIVFTEGDVVKIDSEDLLDRYIQGTLSGSMIAFSGIKKVDNATCLTGMFFDTTKTITEEISLPLYRSNVQASSAKDEEDDEDVDDEDDVFSDEDEDEDDES